MKRSHLLLLAASFWLLPACVKSGKTDVPDQERYSELRDSLQRLADRQPGEIGIAVITDRGDTLTVNNEAKYPLMSVFKLHQAIALCHRFEQTGESIDSTVCIPRRDLNPDTWSPMLKDYTGDTLTLPIKSLLNYTLTLSDNNASNWMYEHLQTAAETDCYIATVIPRETFSISHTEAEMGLDHPLAYDNRTSPLGAAILIDRLYTDSIIGKAHADFIRTTLDECRTGEDRIVAPLKDLEGVRAGHKTGSGYRNADGILAAHNDVAFIRLPDGRHYTLAVFVKDFNGSEAEAAAAIAEISQRIYTEFQKKNL